MSTGEAKASKPDTYANVSFSRETPIGTMSFVEVKKVPESFCSTWKKDFIETVVEGCPTCELVVDDCRNDVAEIYKKALKKEDIGLNYIRVNAKYPEVTVYNRIPDDSFDGICTIVSESADGVTCHAI